MRIALFPAPGNAWRWRLDGPAKYLRKRGIDARIITTGITKEVAEWADIYVLENCIDRNGIALLYEYQQEHGKRIVVECDDYLYPDDSNPHKIEHQIVNAAEVVKRTMEIADLVTCTTEYLADRLRKINPKVAVLPNYPDLEVWDLPKFKNTSDTVRIGWAGSITHIEDLRMIVEPLKHICKDFPQARLIFVGDVRIKDYLEDCPVEIFLGVPFDAWPTRLHGLRLDIGLAPLRDTEFNKCKSRIKHYEYAIAKVPGVYSPTVYNFHGFDGKFGMIAENEDQWYASIRNLILNQHLREDIAESAYTFVTRRLNLEKHIGEWEKAYKGLT